MNEINEIGLVFKPIGEAATTTLLLGTALMLVQRLQRCESSHFFL